jgi:hypothetical protein
MLLETIKLFTYGFYFFQEREGLHPQHRLLLQPLDNINHTTSVISEFDTFSLPIKGTHLAQHLL